jgi:outer membrane lipoprotein SlyB
MKKLTLAAATLAMTLALGGCADDDYHSGYYYTSSPPHYSIYNDGYSTRYYTRYSDDYYGWGY